jgi:hypothetical protein
MSEGLTIELPAESADGSVGGAGATASVANEVEKQSTESELPAKSSQSPVTEVPGNSNDQSRARPAPAPDPVAPPDDAEAADVPDAAADRPPIPNSAIASTIRKIGFSCDSVVSTVKVGEVYKITCGSGRTYRGTTKNGRLRFREWGDSRNEQP